MKRSSIFFLVIFSLFIGGWFVLQNKLNDLSSAKSLFPIKINDIRIEVELVETLEERTRGLSNIRKLSENQGMFFVFQEPKLYPFWMKDMRFSIDIIWISGDGKIVDIIKNIQPDSFPQIFKPREPAQYVLEVNAGWTDKNNIDVGALVPLDNLPLFSKTESVNELIIKDNSF
ncbi:MAG: DUF192 domain-containing protein [Patescibacteria group bacterium]|nr:DUF192 domain-containing protein [Patescibacteria group bacterium]